MSYTLAGGRLSQDDQIQLAITNSSGSSGQTILCEMCHKDITRLSVQKRQEHYEHHFNDNTPPVAGSSSSSSSKWPFKEKDVFWYPSLSTPPPPNYNPGMSLHLIAYQYSYSADSLKVSSPSLGAPSSNRTLETRHKKLSYVTTTPSTSTDNHGMQLGAVDIGII